MKDLLCVGGCIHGNRLSTRCGTFLQPWSGVEYNCQPSPAWTYEGHGWLQDVYVRRVRRVNGHRVEYMAYSHPERTMKQPFRGFLRRCLKCGGDRPVEWYEVDEQVNDVSFGDNSGVAREISTIERLRCVRCGTDILRTATT